MQNHNYDIIICGGGLAGLTLARQLKLKFPEKSVLILAKNSFPLPENTFKVGESSVEVSCFYFREVLGLQNYFKNAHFKKLGFRFIFGPSDKCISERPELGISAYPSFDSYQMDRRVLENDLYEMNLNLGVEIKDKASVTDIVINEDDMSHEVCYIMQGEKKGNVVSGRWVIDAMGRRSFLQQKFNLKIPPKVKHSAVWFRVKGRLDIEDIVPKDRKEWHQRVPEKTRYYSTNHLIGKGYWVWLIPLPSDNTSIGIVTKEELYPLHEYDTLEKALGWIEKHEPMLYGTIKQFVKLDFGRIKNYSYSSKQIFSAKRWASIGEAGFFTDPFYSPGSNMIAYENMIVEKLIEQDEQGKMSSKEVERFNNFMISANEYLTKSIQSSYLYFDKENVKVLSFLWDITVGWSFGAPLIINSSFLDCDVMEGIYKVIPGYHPLLERVYSLFQEWSALTKKTFTFDYIDYLSVPFIKEIYDRNLQGNKSVEQLLEDLKMNMERLEEFALVIFELAVKDAIPEQQSQLVEADWLNAWSIGLDSKKWESEDLFRPSTSPRNLNKIRYEIKSLLKYRNRSESQEEIGKPVKANLAF